MTYKLAIPFRLPGLNEYTDANRRSPYEGAKLKEKTQDMIAVHIRKQLRGVRITKPVTLSYLWIECNRKRDKDNIAFAQKYVQDALVRTGVLSNDGWDQVVGFDHKFGIDREKPRVVVLIKEVDKEEA